MNIKTLYYEYHKKIYNKLKEEERQTLDMDFGDSSDVLRTNYLDMYEGVQVDVVCSDKFDECSDLNMTYFCGTNMMIEERFPISGQGYTMGKLLDDTDYQILLDTSARKSYMSKSFYLKCKLLHVLPKFASNTQRIPVGNGQYVGVLFIIPVIVEIHGHRFEVFTLVSEIHENVNLVLGIKNIFELEGVIDSHESCFNFLNRSIPFFPKEQIVPKPKEQRFVKMKEPSVKEISGIAIVKMLDKQEQVTVMLKLKFIRNKATLNVTNNTQETVIFELKEMIGILDLRSLGYYKIRQCVLQKNLSKYYLFEPGNVWCEQFNKFMNTLMKEEEESKEEYPWLDKDDERKYMTEKYWTSTLT